MKRIRLLMGVVHSIPIGSDFAKKEAYYQEFMKPVLRALFPRSKFNFTFYFSGPTIEFLQNFHPEYLTAFSQMNLEKRIELLGGGYFDPIFPLIPRNDRFGQIEYHTTVLRKIFGKRPRGAYISNYFWEHDLAATFNSAGFEYTFLDDSFFVRAGLEEEDIVYPALTEDQGKSIIIFPVSGIARSFVFQKEAADFVDWMISRGDEGGESVLTVFLDYNFNEESHGSKDAKREQWLGELFDEVLARRKEIEPQIPSKLLKQFSYFTKAYFEAPSIEDINAIAVGKIPDIPMPGDPQVLLSGVNRVGYFAQKNVRHSLARYPEANLIYAKMIYVNTLLNQLKGDKYRKLTAQESLWLAQHQAAYWHGPEGGIYINEVRKLSYKALIDSEYNARSKAIFSPGIVSLDFDFDGAPEYLYQDFEYNAYVHERGGMVFELDCIQKTWNYADTCARHPEMYHLSGLESLDYDLYWRRIFVDHILPLDLLPKKFFEADFDEAGGLPYRRYELLERGQNSLTFKVYATSKPNKVYDVLIYKKYEFLNNSISVQYTIENINTEIINLCFGTEINLSFESDNLDTFSAFSLNKSEKNYFNATLNSQIIKSKCIGFEDNIRDLTLSINSSQSDKFWISPLKTHVKTNQGFIEEYQGTSVLIPHQVNLKPESSITFKVNLEFKENTI